MVYIFVEETVLQDGRKLVIIRLSPNSRNYSCLTLCERDILDPEWFVRDGTLEECREAYDEIVSADTFV